MLILDPFKQMKTLQRWDIHRVWHCLCGRKWEVLRARVAMDLRKDRFRWFERVYRRSKQRFWADPTMWRRRDWESVQCVRYLCRRKIGHWLYRNERCLHRFIVWVEQRRCDVRQSLLFHQWSADTQMQWKESKDLQVGISGSHTVQESIVRSAINGSLTQMNEQRFDVTYTVPNTSV